MEDSFLLESINEILEEVVPKEEYANIGCTYGDTELDAEAVVYGKNQVIADIISKAKEMGFKI